MTRSLNRRDFLGGMTGGALLLGLAACGSSDQAGGGGAPAAGAAGPFTWTDARGHKIHLATAPSRVVAQSSVAASLWDAGFHVTGVYGELGKVGGKLNYQAGAIDLAKVTVLGRTYGQFDIERYAALHPGLLADLSFDSKTLWYITPDVEKQIDKIAPTLGAKIQGYSLPRIIAEFTDLAGRLGADTAAAGLPRAKADFTAAVAAVRAAAAANPKLTVLPVSRDPDKFYFADATQHPDLAELAALGVRFPRVKAAPGTYFVEASWEQIGKYPADVIIYDARETPDVARTADRMATWRRLPAVRAGQVYPWYPAAPYSYRTYAPLFRDVAGWLDKARPVPQS